MVGQQKVFRSFCTRCWNGSSYHLLFFYVVYNCLAAVMLIDDYQSLFPVYSIPLCVRPSNTQSTGKSDLEFMYLRYAGKPKLHRKECMQPAAAEILATLARYLPQRKGEELNHQMDTSPRALLSAENDKKNSHRS